jgi:hypothetical protein
MNKQNKQTQTALAKNICHLQPPPPCSEFVRACSVAACAGECVRFGYGYGIVFHSTIATVI